MLIMNFKLRLVSKRSITYVLAVELYPSSGLAMSGVLSECGAWAVMGQGKAEITAYATAAAICASIDWLRPELGDNIVLLVGTRLSFWAGDSKLDLNKC